MKEQASQPKVYSLYESIFNVLVGFGINVFAQSVVFPWFGIYIPLSANLGIALIFTIISIIRSFTLRRFFNWIHIRKL